MRSVTMYTALIFAFEGTVIPLLGYHITFQIPLIVLVMPSPFMFMPFPEKYKIHGKIYL